MSFTPPRSSRSTPSPRSTPPTKALTHPTVSPYSDTPVILRANQSSASQPEPLRTKPISPKAQTNLSTPKPRHHIPHHHHRHHESAKTVQAALLQSTAFGELLSPVKSTAGGFLARGNGGEESKGKGAKKEPAKDEGGLLPTLGGGEMRVVKDASWADVIRQKEQRVEVEKKVREQLSSLSNFATSTTRNLDYTYYSLLSSLPSIESSLSLLIDLAAQSRTLLDEFTGSSIPSLTADISSQIAVLQSNFDNVQRERITSLESRMRVARERVIGLGERVEGVKTRVEEWEQREKDGKRRGRRRASILWGILGTLFGLFLIMIVIQGWQGDSDGLDDRAKLEVSRRIDAIFGDENVADAAPGLLDDGRPPKGTTSSAAQETSTQDDFDARLRVFDEL
ncbi:hypothetical protein MMC11_007560 [Xylographa trunciseda]|nr:hypothetical protein [Xylographa trunciseda]